MILLFPSLIHFKSDEQKLKFRPRFVSPFWKHVDVANHDSCHMFYGERVIDIADGLPKWSGVDEKSELIEDSPPELVKEFAKKKQKEQEEDKENGDKQ